MQQLGLRLTNRDIEILKFINEFGFCEISHISRRFNLKRPRNYQVIKRLINAGFIKHERIFYGRPGIYKLTIDGSNLTTLPPISKVPLSVYEHNLKLIDLYITLSEKHQNLEWMSERQLKHDKFKDGVGQTGHICDGIMVFPDGKKIAIELELSMKGERRLNQILKNYSMQFEFNEIWYFCEKGLVGKIQKAAEKLSYIRVFSMEDIYQ